MDNLNGLMEENIKGIGKTGNSTEEAFILEAINRKEKVNGTKEKESDGSKKKMKLLNDYKIFLFYFITIYINIYY